MQAQTIESPALAVSPFDLLLRLTRAASTPLYALADGAVDQQIVPLLYGNRDGSRMESLYSGESERTLAAWAPYLVHLPPEAPLLARLLERGWGNAWATYFFSDAPFEDLRRHFRKFLMVQVEGRGEAYFRFYDPRVLRDYLPTANANELAEFFGPVTRWMIEAPDGGLLVMQRGPSGLTVQAVSRDNLISEK